MKELLILNYRLNEVGQPLAFLAMGAITTPNDLIVCFIDLKCAKYFRDYSWLLSLLCSYIWHLWLQDR